MMTPAWFYRTLKMFNVAFSGGSTSGSAGSLKSKDTTGLMQITGPAAEQTRVVTIPDANCTMARKDADERFVGNIAAIGHSVVLIAGENLVRGEVVYIKITSGADGKVWKAPTSGDMPIGVVYANANADTEVIIIVAGIAHVLPESGITAARGNVIFTSGSQAGRVDQSATVPVSEHWRECGHLLDTGSGNGVLTRAIIHFN